MSKVTMSIIIALCAVVYIAFLSPSNSVFYSDFSIFTSDNAASYLGVDSERYMNSGSGAYGILELVIPQGDDVGISFGLASNLLLYVIATVAHAFGDFRYWFVAAINGLLFYWMLFNYWHVLGKLALPVSSFNVLLIINPILLFTVFTLNKELLGMAVISYLVRLLFDGHKLYFFIFSVFSSLVKSLFLYWAVIAYVLARFRIGNIGIYLIGFSFIFPFVNWLVGGDFFGGDTIKLGSVSTLFDQKTSGLLVTAFDISQYPLGMFVSVPIISGINILSPVLNPDYWRNLFDGVILVEGILLQISSAAFFIVLIILGYSCYRVRSVQEVNWLFVKILTVYLTLIGLFPLSQHRYLIPIYPVLVLAFVYTRACLNSACRAVKTKSICYF